MAEMIQILLNSARVKQGGDPVISVRRIVTFVFDHLQGVAAVSVVENKTLIHRYIDEAWNKGAVDILDELYDPSFIGGYGGIPGFKTAITSYRTSFPDLHFSIDDVVAEGESIAFRWTARGTHQADFAGIAATGKPITVTGITILRIVDGKIIDDRSETTNHTLAAQLD
jgi:predicted ester cyclase